MFQNHIYPIAFSISCSLFVVILNISNDILDKAFPYSVPLDDLNSHTTINYMYNVNMYDVLMICNAMSEQNEFLSTYNNTLLISIIVMFLSYFMTSLLIIEYMFKPLFPITPL